MGGFLTLTQALGLSFRNQIHSPGWAMRYKPNHTMLQEHSLIHWMDDPVFWPDVTGGNPTADLLTKVRKFPSLIYLFEWMVLVWLFIQYPHLKGRDGKEIKAAPIEVTLGFLRSTGVDEKHLARKPGCQNPRSEGTQPHHQERGSSSVVFWPVLKFFKFANQRTASCIRSAKGLHNAVDYISDFLILCETMCLTLPAGIMHLPLKEVNCSKGKRYVMGEWLDFSPRKHVVHLPSGIERCTHIQHLKTFLATVLLPSPLSCSLPFFPWRHRWKCYVNYNHRYLPVIFIYRGWQ